MDARERAGCPDADLVALLLRVTGEPLGEADVKRVREALGGLRGLLRLSPAEAVTRGGLSAGAVLRIRDALELARAAWAEPDGRPHLRGARDVFERFAALSAEPLEELWVLIVDGANRLVARERVGGGDASRVPATPADVLAPCVRLGARRVILVHNHPSGVATPSRDDVAFTRSVVRAGRLLGIAVLDHVVIGAGEWRSLRDGALVPFAA